MRVCLPLLLGILVTAPATAGNQSPRLTAPPTKSAKTATRTQTPTQTPTVVVELRPAVGNTANYFGSTIERRRQAALLLARFVTG